MSTPSQQLVKIDDTPKPLTKPQARALDKKVRAASDRVIKNLDDAANSWQKLVELLEQAVLEDVHTLLGYATWTAYFKDAVRLTFNDRAERKSLVLLMSDKGMSTRVIADILGISNATVSRDGSGVTAVTADNVVGIDGKKYPKKPAPEPEPEPPLDVDEVPIPEPESEPAPPKQNSFSEDFREELYAIQIVVQAFRDLIVNDERFPKARARLAKSKLADEFRAVIGNLDELLGIIQGDKQ